MVFAALTVISGAFILSKGEYLLAYDFGFVRGIFCFMLGIFTHLILSKKQFRLTVLEWPFVVVLVLGMFLVHRWELNLWKMVFPFFFSAGIIIFTGSDGIVTKLLASKPLQYIGKISYSIYLNHALVLILVNVALFRFFRLPAIEPMVGLSLVVSIVLTILYSHFTYQWIELGVGRFLRGRLG
jgi:peptidoglycan/LPS O-acetylase OafA/YrhL